MLVRNSEAVVCTFQNFCGTLWESDVGPLYHNFAYRRRTVVEGQGHCLVPVTSGYNVCSVKGVLPTVHISILLIQIP